MIDRRKFLESTLAAGCMSLSAPLLGAQASMRANANAKVPLGFHNAPANGIEPERLTLVSGRAPQDLRGTLYRNGPAHFRRGDQMLGHWFDGDGLVRAFSVNGNTATLAARFVQTVKRKQDTAAGLFIMPGFGTRAAKGAPVGSPDDANAANTSLLTVGEQLWALWEAGSPYAIDPQSLETIGPVTLRPDLEQMPFSAHPKVDRDGVIWNFGMAYGSPLTFVWALGPKGNVLKTGMVDLPMAAYLHDWVVSETKLIIPLQPWIFEGTHPPFAESLAWKPERGLKVLVVDKNDFSDTKLYTLPPGAFFHTGGVYEGSDGTISFDICLSDRPTLDAKIGAAMLQGGPQERTQTYLQRAVLRPNGKAELISTGIPAEFPQTSQGHGANASSKVFFVSEGKETSDQAYRYNAVCGFDWSKETADRFDFGADVLVEEPLFVSAGLKAGSGYLLLPALHMQERATYLHVFDANGVAAGPIASWRSRHPLPLSFHGTWKST